MLVIRPSSTYGLGAYNTAWVATPPGPYADVVDDVVADGDASYVAATVPGAAFTTKLSSGSSGEGWPRPVRLRSILVIATTRRLGVDAATWKFRLRYSGINYDSQVFSTNTASYRETYWFLPISPTGAGWSLTSLADYELGLVYISGGTELRCTKLEIQVQTELQPDFRLAPAGAGTFNAWGRNIPTLPAEQMVNGAFDGDISYLQSVLAGDQSSFTLSTLPPIPVGMSIDRVQTKAAVRTTDIVNAASAAALMVVGGIPYRGGAHQLYSGINADAYPSELVWSLLEEEYLNCPSAGWPSGLPLATAWTPLELATTEVGIENGDAVPVRCTNLTVDVFLKHTPSSVASSYPTANSAWHTSLLPLVPNAGEQAWQDINENPPDDAATYIGATAVDGEPVYGTFQCGPAPFPLPTRQVYALELRTRCTLGSTASAVVAHVMNDRLTGETWIGKPFRLSGVAGTWFDLKEDLPLNPLTAGRWATGAVNSYDFGWVILDGEVFLSRLRVQYQFVPAFLSLVPGASDLQLTNEAVTWINKANLDGSVYEIDTFAVGTGGYNPAVPTSVLAVNPADVALAAEVKQFPIRKVTFRESSVPGISWYVTYYCRVPRSELHGYTSGEVGLFARVLWSPVPAEIGYQFMFALGHYPAQVGVEDDVYLFEVTLAYP